MAQRVDFTSEAFFRDPAVTVAMLRAIGPAVETRFPIVGKVWVTTTYEATAHVLKESATFSRLAASTHRAGSTLRLVAHCRKWSLFVESASTVMLSSGTEQLPMRFRPSGPS